MASRGSSACSASAQDQKGPEQGRSDTEIQMRKHGNISEY